MLPLNLLALGPFLVPGPGVTAVSALPSQVDAPRSAVTAKLWQDEEALAKGAEALAMLTATAGGTVQLPPDVELGEDGTPLPAGDEDEPVEASAWRYLPGLRYQILETKRGMSRPESGRWETHYFLPRLVHVAPSGEGYLNSEYASLPMKATVAPEPLYYREVATDAATWVEVNGLSADRNQEKASQARGRFDRELFLSLMPHGLSLLGVRAAWVEDQEYEDETIGVYLVRLPRDVMFAEHDRIRLFQLYVRKNDWTPLQARCQPGGHKRGEAICDFEGSVELLVGEAELDHARRVWVSEQVLRLADAGRLELDAAGQPVVASELLADLERRAEGLVMPEMVRVPKRHYLLEEGAFERLDFDKAEAAFAQLEPEALAKPWLVGSVWTDAPRADHWDPPAEEDGGAGPGSPEQGAEGR